jgi:hypothetical protein
MLYWSHGGKYVESMATLDFLNAGELVLNSYDVILHTLNVILLWLNSNLSHHEFAKPLKMYEIGDKKW